MKGTYNESERLFWINLGESVCAPLYFSLCHWIRGKLDEEPLGQLLFLAREGHPLMRAWHRLYGENKPVRTDYLYASRRCLKIASMRAFSDREVEFLLSTKAPVTVGMLLRQIGLNFDSLSEVAKSLGIVDENVTLRSPGNREKMRKFLLKISGSILEQAQSERQVYLKYLDSLGLFTSSNRRVGVVDIGWQASLQSALQEIFNTAGGNVQLTGFYLGTIAPLRLPDPNNAQGLFFNASAPSEHLATAKCCRELIEILFTAPHPTILRINNEKDLCPEYADHHENAESLGNLQIMQDAALDALEEKAEYWRRDPDSIKEGSINSLRQLLRFPTRQESRILGDLRFFDGFGNPDNTTHLAKYLSREWNLPALRNQYRNCYWRAGFLKRLNPLQRLLLKPLILGMPVDRMGRSRA